MIALQLSRDEALFLTQQLRRHEQTVENELVHTDAHRMQHELARDLDDLRSLEERLLRAVADEDDRDRDAVGRPGLRPQLYQR
jgi:hypothetical protein